MALATGSKLGQYEIVSSLGAGGMGEVYRARDPKLEREVAIKVLPEAFAEDEERLARFEREAKALAALNHPNIATVHGFEQEEETHFLVMELVEGEDLAERIARGPIPVDEAIPLFIQIAEGLEAAHERGIVHRDLKPANIKVGPDGRLKILDFGLAKTTEASSPEVDPSQSPTMTASAMPGEIMGTAAYMSPEQARGLDVGKQTDIWAFGVCLFEALSGRSPFGRETRQDSLASVIEREPPWTALPVSVTHRMRALLERCLAKVRRSRWHDIADVRLELEAALVEEPPSTQTTLSRVPSHPGWILASAAATAAVLLLAIRAGLLPIGQPIDPQRPDLRYEVALPEAARLPGGRESTLTLSPDGERLAYVGSVDGRSQLYVHNLNEFVPRVVLGTEGAVTPRFSPDGETLLYGLNFRSLRRISLTGEQGLELCEPCVNPQWTDSGSVLYQWGSALFRAPSSGDSSELVLEPLPEHGLEVLDRPFQLPESEIVLFEFRGRSTERGVGAYRPSTGDFLEVTSDGSDPTYSDSGHILFGRANALFGVAFDEERFELRGPALPVLDDVRIENGGAVQVALSRDGVLAYAPASTRGTELVWVGRDGAVLEALEPWRTYYAPRLSPDGRQIAVVVDDGGSVDVWLRSVESRGLTPLTSQGDASYAVWSPDGRSVAFASGAAGAFRLQTISAEGGSESRVLHESAHRLIPEAWPEEGKLVLREERPEPRLLLLNPISGETKALFEGDFDQFGGAVSPDGQWLAYVSGLNGQREIFVRRLDGSGPGIQASTSAASEPRWSGDGKSLFYRSWEDRALVSTILKFDPLRIADQEPVFLGDRYWWFYTNTQYDVDPSGDRFLMLNTVDETAQPAIRIIHDFHEVLNRVLPTDGAEGVGG